MFIKKIPKRASKIILGVLIFFAIAIGGYYAYKHKPVEQREIDADVVAIKRVPTEIRTSFFTQDQKEIQEIYSILSSKYDNSHAHDYEWSIVFYKNGEIADIFWINEIESKYHAKLKPYLSRARGSKQETSELKILLSEMLPYEYKLVYSKHGFEVREVLIEDQEIFRSLSSEYTDKIERIGDTEKDYTFEFECSLDEIQIKRCPGGVTVLDSLGKELGFTFDRGERRDEYVIKKDGNEIWRGDLRGISCSPIFSVVQINDKLAVDYHDARDDVSYLLTDSILLLQDQGVKDISKETRYDQAFSPHNIRGELAYFGKQGDQVWLNYDDEKVAHYGKIVTDHYQDPCQSSVFSNGNLVDFFARKNGKVYHVQAGYFDGN